MLEPLIRFWNSFSPANPARSHLAIRNQYEAAGSGRRLRSWQPGLIGPNQGILGSLDTLRSRSRDATRNNAWIKKGINSWASNEIGTGIEPRSLAPDPEFRKRAKELWDEWTEVADADNMLSFYGMLSLSSRTRVEAGEIFWRFRPRPLSEGLPVPLQLQLLEPEMCPVGETRDFGGRKVRAGIEFDGIGKRRAYWMYRNHPGDVFNGLENTELVPVPADSVIHHFAPLRAGQIRGLPWTIQSLIKAKDFDDYDDAELVRKRDKATYTGFVTRPALDPEQEGLYDPLTGDPISTDIHGVPVVNHEPGTFMSGLPGEDVKLFEGDNTGSGYADFVRQQLLGVAAGLDIPYEFLTGDMSKVNDRLMRVILNEFHRILMQSQWHLTIPQICRPVWNRFIDLAVLSGALSAPGYATRRAEYLKVDWRTDRWDYMHPLQDVQAEALMVKEGFKSRQAVVAERGDNAEDVDAQNAEDKKRADDLGLKYGADAAAKPAEPQEPEEEEVGT